MNYDSMGVVLKLVSGETIICQVVSDTEKTMIVRDPYLINVFSEKHSTGVKAMTYYSDWFMGTTSRIHMLRKEHVMSAAIPDSEVKKDYAMLVENRNDSDQKNKETSSESMNWNDLDFKFGTDDPQRN